MRVDDGPPVSSDAEGLAVAADILAWPGSHHSDYTDPHGSRIKMVEIIFGIAETPNYPAAPSHPSTNSSPIAGSSTTTARPAHPFTWTKNSEENSRMLIVQTIARPLGRPAHDLAGARAICSHPAANAMHRRGPRSRTMPPLCESKALKHRNRLRGPWGAGRRVQPRHPRGSSSKMDQ